MPQEAPDGAIIISAKEAYDGVQADIRDIKQSIANIANAVSPLPMRVKDLEERAEEQGRQIQVLERKIAYFTGIGSALGAAVGALIPYLVK